MGNVFLILLSKKGYFGQEWPDPFFYSFFYSAGTRRREFYIDKKFYIVQVGVWSQRPSQLSETEVIIFILLLTMGAEIAGVAQVLDFLDFASTGRTGIPRCFFVHEANIFPDMVIKVVFVITAAL